MKKIIFILVLFCVAFVGNGQQPVYPNYTNINSGYQWIRGLFTALGAPAGGNASFQTGQLPRAGALYYDSTGADSGFYVWSGLAWRQAGSNLDTTSLSNRINLKLNISDTAAMLLPYLRSASEGLSYSGQDVRLGGPTGSNAPLTTDRGINLNRRTLSVNNGHTYATGDYGYTPFSVTQIDTITTTSPPTTSVPLYATHFQRTFRYTTGHRTINTYGHRMLFQHEVEDSARLRGDGGDKNASLIADQWITPMPSWVTKSLVISGHGTNSWLQPREAVPSLLGNVVVRGNGIGGYVYFKGYTNGISSYLVMDGNGTDTVENHIYYSGSSFVVSPAKLMRSFFIHPQSAVLDNVVTPDSSYFLYNPYAMPSYMTGNQIFGYGSTYTPYKLRVNGATYLSDSLTVGTQTEVSDTTGYDVVLRRRTDGSYVRIRADLLGVGGTTPGIDDVLAQAQSLTTGRTITTGANVLTITGTPSTTLNVLNSGTGAAIQGAAAGTGNGVYGISDGGPAVRGTSNTGPGLYGTSTDDAAGTLEINPASTNTVQPVLKLFRSTSGTAAAGIGGSIQFINERSNGSTNSTSNEIHSVWTNATDGAQTSQLNVLGVNAAASETFMNIQTGGVVRVNNNADTLATKAYARSVGGSGGGASTALDNLASVAINTSLISDADNTDDLGSSTFAWKDGYLYRVLAQGATSGQVEYKSETNGIAANGTTASGDGVIPVEMKARLTSDFGLADVGTDQTAFPSTIDVITLQGGTVYEFEIYYRITHGNVAVSTATGFTAGGGLTINSITYNTVSHVAAADNTTSASNNSTDVIQLASTVVTASSASTKVFIVVRGEIDVNVGGTLEPIIKFSAAPGTTGSANNMKAGTRYKFTPIGPTGMTKIGNIN